MFTSKPYCNRLIIVFTLFLGVTTFLNSSAQENLLLFPDLYYKVEGVYLKSPGYHSALYPPQISLRQKKLLVDSLYGSRDKDFINYEKGNTSLSINPILQSSFRTGSTFLQHYVAGFRLESEFSSKFSFDLNYSFHLLTNHAFPNSRLDSAGIVDHWGRAVNINKSLEFFNSINGKITYTPNRFLSFQLGNDKHFWGDGYRSLFISDNAPSYPFLATTLHIWNIKYTSMVTILRDDTLGNYNKLLTKYASMHFLSWNVNKRLNINVFEAVVWRSRNDSANTRGFSLAYLNPFIFYRPLEYNLGSPDNVLIGIGGHYLFGNQGMIYGQFMLDEFYYKEIIKNKGWWAIKDAFQLGVKWFNVCKLKDLYLQLEYNQARPYTYGHDYPLQNYGYMLQPLAHPLGTNFREAFMIMRYSKNRWFLNARFTYARYGTEPGGKTVGGDIYRSSNDFAKTYGNFIGQGITTDIFEQEVTLSRVLQSHWGLIAEAGVHNAFIRLPEKQQRIYISFGIKTLLYREEKLF